MADSRAFTLTPTLCAAAYATTTSNIDGDAKQLLRSSARDGLELLLD